MITADRFTHRAFVVGMLFKGVDGCLELIGAAALLLTTRPEIRDVVAWLTRAELVEDPTDFFATHAVRMAQHLTSGTEHFAAAYLLVHGGIKVALAACLLRELRWVFPVALIILTTFIGYQVDLWVHAPAWPLGVLTFVDIVVVVLVAKEWRMHRPHRMALPPPHP